MHHQDSWILTVNKDAVNASITVGPEVNAMLATTIRAILTSSAMISDATALDPLLQNKVHLHHTHWPPLCSDKQLQLFYQLRYSLSGSMTAYSLQNERLCLRNHRAMPLNNFIPGIQVLTA
ncbi:hypothetical protein CRM22_008149 [Opisthorchis felineus]|uniref:Uncharacterized protein n=1 Tax=Opisthorchis felineus TaxID=147828 RepID=A0A4S2LKU4_OPIFE|nr:hypothetical protein CRM22_008149 [Opisthorchis felineus]